MWVCVNPGVRLGRMRWHRQQCGAGFRATCSSKPPTTNYELQTPNYLVNQPNSCAFRCACALIMMFTTFGLLLANAFSSVGRN